MQVRVLQSMAGAERSWAVGDLYECEADEAGRLIEAGIAEALQAAKVETATAPKVKK
jgi:hypothetical protein